MILLQLYLQFLNVFFIDKKKYVNAQLTNKTGVLEEKNDFSLSISIPEIEIHS